MPTLQQVQEILYRARFEDQATAAARAATTAIEALNNTVEKTEKTTSNSAKSVNQLNAQNDILSKTARQLINVTNDLNTAQSALGRELAAGGEGAEQLGRTVLALIDKQSALQAKTNDLVQAQDALGSSVEAAQARLQQMATGADEAAAGFDSLRATYDPLYAASMKYAQGLSDIERLQERGSFNTKQAELAMDSLTAAYAKASSVTAQISGGFDAVSEAANRAAQATLAAKEASQFQQTVNYHTGVDQPAGNLSNEDYAKRTADLQSYFAALDAGRAEYDSVFRVSKQYSDQLERIDFLVRAGALSEGQANIARENVTAAYAKANSVMGQTVQVFDAVAEAATRAAQAENSAKEASQFQQVVNYHTGVDSSAGSMSDTDYAARQADLDAYGKTMDATRAKFDPLFKASKAYEVVLNDLNLAVKSGAVSEPVYTEALGRMNDAFAKGRDVQSAASGSLKAYADESTKTGYISRLLGIQVIQTASSITAGMPVWLTLVQQGHQVFDIFLASQMSIKDFGVAMNSVFSVIGGFSGALTLGVVGALVAFGVAANSNIAKMADIRSALRGTRDNYSELAQTVEDVSHKIAASSVITTAAAKEAAQAFLSNQYYSGTATDLERLIRDSGDLGRVLGTDAADGAKKLSAGIGDTYKAAEALSPTISTLSGRTLELIKRYQDMGESGKAFALFMSTIEDRIRGQAADISPLAKAWNELSEVFVKTNTTGSSLSTWFANDLANSINSLTGFLKDVIEKFGQLMGLWEKASNFASSTWDKFSSKTSPQDALNQQFAYATGGAAPSPMNTGATGSSVLTSSSTKEQFINDWMEAAQMAGKRLGNSPEVLLGQWGNETGWGKNLHDFNAGNIQAGAGYTGNTVIRGDNHADGSAYQTQFRSYANPMEFAEDFVKVLSSDRYSGARNINGDGAAYAGGLKRGGYFEDPNGVRNITRAVDSLQNGGLNNGSSSGGVSAGQVDQHKLLNDQLQKQFENERALKDLKYQDDLSKIHLVQGQIIEDYGKSSPQYQASIQQEQRLTAEYKNNVGAQELAARARASSLAATEGMTEGQRGLNAAMEAGREIARQTGNPFGPSERLQATIDYLAKANQQYAQLNFTINENIKNNGELAAAYGTGDQAALTAVASQKALSEAMKLFPDDVVKQGAAVASLTEKYLQLDASAARAGVAQQNLSSRDNIDLLNTETATIGMNSDARDVLIAKMRAESEMHRKFGDDILNKEAQEYINLAQSTVQAQQSLTQMQNSFNDLQNIGVTAFDTVGQAITQALVNGNGKAIDFGNVFKGVISSILQEVIKLGVINPILNSVFGGQRGTLSSALSAYNSGGSGGLFGGSASTSAGGDLGAFDGPGSNSNISSFDGPGASASGGGLMGGATAVLGGAGAVYNIGQLVTTQSASSVAVGAAADAFSGAGVSLTAASPSLGITAEGGLTTLAATSSALSAVTSALPYIGAGIGVITSFAKGDYVGGVATLAGAAIGTAILPGVGTALGAVLGSTIGGLFGNKHPENPFQTAGVNVQDGRVVLGTVASQKEDISGALKSVKDFATGVNDYLASVHLTIANPNGRIGGVGDNVKGFEQVKSASDLFQTLSFRPDGTATNQDSNFYKAESGALAGTKFMTPQELQDQLIKVAQFSDGLDTFGVHLASVGQRLTDIKIGSIDKLADGIAAVDAQGKPTAAGQFRTALQNDLPSQTFATTDAFWAEVNKVNQFVNGTLPSLLNPVIDTTSQLQTQIQTMVKTYADAIAQAQSYGLATEDLTKAQGEAVALLQKSALIDLSVSNVAIAKRGASARGEDTSQYDLQTFDLQANQQREALKQQYINIYGSLIPDAQEYGAAAVTLDQTLAAERLKVQTASNTALLNQQQAADSAAFKAAVQANRSQYDAQFSVQQTFDSIRARSAAVGGDQKTSDLITFDDTSKKEYQDYARQLVDFYGNSFSSTQDYQNRLSELETVQQQERLAIVKKYGDAGNTITTQAMQTAQQNVGQLVDSLKGYAQSLKTGSDSPLSAVNQYSLSKKAFTEDQQKSNMGDYAATQQLQRLAQDFLSTSRAVNGSGAGYAADYNQVLDALTAVANVPQDVLTNSAIQANLQTQTVALSAKFDELRAELVALRKEYQQQARALAA